jgi:hypothetical protein
VGFFHRRFEVPQRQLFAEQFVEQAFAHLSVVLFQLYSLCKSSHFQEAKKQMALQLASHLGELNRKVWDNWLVATVRRVGREFALEEQGYVIYAMLCIR